MNDLPIPGSEEAPKDRPADAPPPPDAPPKREKRERAIPAPRTTSLEKRLTELYVSLGSLVVVADPTCGQAVIAAAPETAAALEALAKENPKVRKALEKMLAGGAWGGVLMAHFPIVVTVLAHHNMLPSTTAAVLGVTPKAKPTLRTVPDPSEDESSVGSGTPVVSG